MEEEEVEVQEEDGEEFDKHLSELRQIYYNKKFGKVFMLIFYSCLIVTYNVGSYFLSNQIMNSSINSFKYLQVVEHRMTCVSDSLWFVIEQFALNETAMTNFSHDTAFEMVMGECFTVEIDYSNLLVDGPKEIEGLSPWLI